MKINAVLVCVGLSIAGGSLFAQPPGPRSVRDGVYSAGQSDRGKPVYVERCASCHGADLSGGDMAPPLAGVSFIANWTDQTLDDLAERIRVTMPLDQPGALNRQQTADIVSFVLSVGGFPAGAADLPSDADSLKQIKILAAKP